MSILRTLNWKLQTIRRIRKEKSFDKKRGRLVNASTGNEVIDSIRNKGFHLIENFISPDTCDAIVEEMLSSMSKNAEFVWSDKHDSDHRLFGIERVAPLINKKFHQNEELKKIGQEYLGYELTNFMTLAGSLTFKEQNLGSGGGWHRDSTYAPQFKAILYLSDVTEANGPYEYVPFSNKLKNILKSLKVSLRTNGMAPEDVNKRYKEEHIQKLGCGTEVLTAKKGSVILTDTQGIHRGRPIESGKRYALTNYYIGTHRLPEFESIFAKLNLP